MSGMSETEDDLRTTSDAVLAGTDRLKSLEEAKRGLEPEDPEREVIAAEIADVGRQVARATAAELDLAHRAKEEADASPGSPERPIEG
jgi:hypothetical protein